MNILITGADGFIGKKLAKSLQTKHNVFSLVLRKVKKLNLKNQIRVDLTQRKKVRFFINKFKKGSNKIDIIIHLAVKLASTDNISDINIFYYNLQITESIVEMARILKPKKIINFSSSAVFPNINGRYNEISEIRPSANSDCLYGLSKFCSENILDFMLREEKIVISHLRISQVYGEGMRKDRIIPTMLKELKEKNTITVFGDGYRVINFIHLDKLLAIVSFFIHNDFPGIFNISNEQLSLMELAQKLIKLNGNGYSRIIKKSKGTRAKFYLDTTKIDTLMSNSKGMSAS